MMYLIYDLHYPLFRRIDQLEMSIAAEKEPPATLPITEGSRASSHSSLDSIVAASGSHSNSTAAAPPPATIAVTASNVVTTTLTQNSVPIQQQAPMSDEEVYIEIWHDPFIIILFCVYFYY